MVYMKSWDPNKKNPVKLSENTMKNFSNSPTKVASKLTYEAMLLRWTIEQLIQIHPYLLDSKEDVKQNDFEQEQLADLEDQKRFFNTVDGSYILDDEYQPCD